MKVLSISLDRNFVYYFGLLRFKPLIHYVGLIAILPLPHISKKHFLTA